MISNTECLIKACQELGLLYEIKDKNGNLVIIKGVEPLVFANGATPFTTHSTSVLFKDKEFTYQTFRNILPQPETKGFIDPQGEKRYTSYRNQESVKEVAERILKEFSLPLILKPNRGQQGKNVHTCTSPTGVREALSKIFNKNHKDYDYIALAQEYVDFEKEYRILVADGVVELVYIKKGEDKGEIISLLDPVYKELQKMFTHAHTLVPISWAGIDVLEDKKGNLFVIDINSAPSFDLLVKINGQEPLVNMYKKMLLKYQGEPVSNSKQKKKLLKS